MSGVKRNRSVLAVGVLAAGAMLVSACSDSPASLPYTAGAKVDCGGKQTLAASGSTAQANAMTRFIDAYRKACSGQTLNYTANGSGSGITDFLAGKTDFAGSDTPLSVINTPPPSGGAAAPTPGTCRWCSARWPSPTTSPPSIPWCSTRPRWPRSSTAPSRAGTTRPWPCSTPPCRPRTSTSSTAATARAPPTTSRPTCSPRPAERGARVRARPSTVVWAPAPSATPASRPP